MNTNRNQSSVTASVVQTSGRCFACDKPIVDGQWFCRLPRPANGANGLQTTKILLCSPTCALRHLGDPQPAGNGFEPYSESFESSQHFSERGQNIN